MFQNLKTMIHLLHLRQRAWLSWQIFTDSFLSFKDVNVNEERGINVQAEELIKENMWLWHVMNASSSLLQHSIDSWV